MNSDFRSWYQENSDFFVHLYGHDSILFTYVKDIIDSLACINDMMDTKEIDSDLENIFDTGYSYLFTYVSELKLYLKNYFNNNFHEFLEYDTYLAYNFYINDIKEVLIEENKYTEDIKNEFEYILNDIEDVLKNKKEYSDDKIDEYNNRIMDVVPKDEYLETIPELFVEVVDQLKL